jgi:hypothetical protein
MSDGGVAESNARAQAQPMECEPIVFEHTGLTVRAAACGDTWQGEIIGAGGEVEDVFAYTRDAFPGAVIGALRFKDLDFTVRLAARLWLHTGQ